MKDISDWSLSGKRGTERLKSQADSNRPTEQRPPTYAICRRMRIEILLYDFIRKRLHDERDQKEQDQSLTGVI